MKIEALGKNTSILYFKANQNKELTNNHVFHLLLSEEEMKKLQWLN